MLSLPPAATLTSAPLARAAPMRWVCIVLVLLLLLPAGPARAQAIDPDIAHEGFTVGMAQEFFTDDIGDPLTSIFLNELFGPLFPAADRSPGADHRTVFSTIVGYFNIIALALGGLLFAWNLTAGLLQTAHEGEILGRRWSTLWAPLRLVFAVGLMMPLPDMGGYNAVQSAVAYIVKGATLTATTMWQVSAKALLKDQVPVAAAQPKLDPAIITSMYRIAACRAIVNAQLKAHGQTQTAVSQKDAVSLRFNHALYWQDVRAGEEYKIDARRFVQFIYYVKPNGNLIRICGHWMSPKINKDINTYLVNSGLDEAAKNDVMAVFRTKHIEILKRLYRSMEDIVNNKAQVILTEKKGREPVPQHSRYIAAVAKAANTEAAVISKNIREMIEARSNSEKNRHKLLHDTITGGALCAVGPFVGAVIACYGEGWLGAGKWYITIARINAHISALTKATGTAEAAGFFVKAERRSWIGQAADRVGDWFTSDAGDYVDRDSAREAWAAFMKSYDNDTRNLAALGFGLDPSQLNLSGMEGSGLRDILGDLVGANLEDAVEAMALIDPSADPLVELMSWGDVLLTITGALMPVLLASPGGGVAGPMVGTMWAAGALLQLILPMMPWILWVVAITGYFLLVVEAVVGVTLWAFAHLRMDGEGISGEAKNGWTLLLALLLTPILMIFGFIVGMMIFRVTSGLLLSGILPAAHAALAGSTVFTVLLALPALTILVAVMQLVLVERSFSLISELPNRVLAWIGGRADLADQGALDRARIGMIGATAGLARAAPNVGAIGTGMRNVLGRLRPAGRAQGGQTGGQDRPTGD